MYTVVINIDIYMSSTRLMTVSDFVDLRLTEFLIMLLYGYCIDSLTSESFLMTYGFYSLTELMNVTPDSF